MKADDPYGEQLKEVEQATGRGERFRVSVLALVVR